MQIEAYITHFDDLFNLTYLVINSLKGKSILDQRLVDCERLAHKIFMHSATIRYLYHGSNVYIEAYKEGGHIEDFASMIVLTRATLETYVNLFEIFFESSDDDELEYRHATFQIEGFKLREIYIPLYPEQEGIRRLEQSSKEIEDMRERVRNTIKYKRLDHNQRMQSLEGKRFPKRSITTIAAVAGFSKIFVEQQYAYQSAYIHGDALSISQIADANNESRTKISPYVTPVIGFVMMVLSKLILNFQSAYPDAKLICEQNPRTMHVVNYMSSLAGEIGSSIGKPKKL